MPAAASDTTRLVPPYEINGKGMPVSGNIAIIAPILINAWAKNHSEMPAANKRENASGALAAICKPRKHSAANSPIITSDPISPNSSAMIAKIESLAASGR